MPSIVLPSLVGLAAAAPAAGQAGDVPSFMPSHPVDELAASVLDPPSADVGVVGLWRQSGDLGLGVRAGILDAAPGGTAFVAGSEFTTPVLRAARGSAVEALLVLGAGATFEEGILARIPAGVSVGGRFTGTGAEMAFAPYVHPRLGREILANDGESETELAFAVDFGVDLELSRTVTLRATYTWVGVLDAVDAVAIHGFPLDWNHWTIHEWPDKIAEVRAVTTRPIWITEVGASSFGAEEIQDFGLRRSAELLLGQVERIHWYSLLDLPRTWPATTRHREAEGSAYYRHFYMGLVREDGVPKLALKRFAEYTPEVGICQWFHFEDPRLDDAVRWLRRLGVRYLRTGLSWADSHRPGWVPVSFARAYRATSYMLWPTPTIAAKWNTASAPSRARRTAAGSHTSPTTSSTSGCR